MKPNPQPKPAKALPRCKVTAKRTPKVPKITFVAADGDEVSFPEKMTLAQLLKAGVKSVRICQPDAPLEPGEYRDKGERVSRIPRKRSKP